MLLIISTAPAALPRCLEKKFRRIPMSQIANKKSVLEMAMGAIAEITDYEV